MRAKRGNLNKSKYSTTIEQNQLIRHNVLSIKNNILLLIIPRPYDIYSGTYRFYREFINGQECVLRFRDIYTNCGRTLKNIVLKEGWEGKYRLVAKNPEWYLFDFDDYTLLQIVGELFKPVTHFDKPATPENWKELFLNIFPFQNTCIGQGVDEPKRMRLIDFICLII